MKIFYRLILFILICWFGYHAFRQTLGAPQHGLFDVMEYFNLIILIILTLAAIASDTVAWRLYRKWFQFYSSCIGLLLCTLVLFRVITLTKIENAKTVLTVSTMANSQNVLSIQFKENNYLQITEFNKLGQNIYYGRYYKNSDTICITQTNYDNLAKTLPYTGTIQGSLLIWNKKDTMHIDKNISP